MQKQGGRPEAKRAQKTPSPRPPSASDDSQEEAGPRKSSPPPIRSRRQGRIFFQSTKRGHCAAGIYCHSAEPRGPSIITLASLVQHINWYQGRRDKGGTEGSMAGRLAGEMEAGEVWTSPAGQQTGWHAPLSLWGGGGGGRVLFGSHPLSTAISKGPSALRWPLKQV